mmetsp:Transcript_22495/g.19456  ORF Transcript_22495/g.19456 Transcript_22495/m.19456 type:complete len:105 (+) Transcript_22495:880-1194(+)
MNQFWEKVNDQRIEKNNFEISDDFKELFTSMIKYNPKKRPTIEEVKKSKWLNGPTYSDSKLKSVCEQKIDDSIFSRALPHLSYLIPAGMITFIFFSSKKGITAF